MEINKLKLFRQLILAVLLVASNLTWALAPAGNYKVKVGASLNDIKNKTDFSLAKDIIAGKVTKAMVSQRDFKRLSK